MNYSNFISRVSISRRAPAAVAEKPARPLPKKTRKAARRRLSVSIVAFALCFGGLDQVRAAFEFTPEVEQTMVFDHPLLEQFKSAIAGMPAVAAPRRPQASLFTLILLGSGVGAALFQLRLICRADLDC